MKTRYTQLSYINNVADEFDLNNEELILLNYLINCIKSKKLEYFRHKANDKIFFWFLYDTILNNIGTRIKCSHKNSISRKLLRLTKKHWGGQPLMWNYTVLAASKTQKKAFYALNWTLIEFLFSDPYSKKYQPVLDEDIAKHYEIDFDFIQQSVIKMKKANLFAPETKLVDIIKLQHNPFVSKLS